MRRRQEQPVNTLILRELLFGPASVDELEAVVRIHRRNLRRYLQLLHDDGKIYVHHWRQRTGPALPVYALGVGDDAPRPKRKYTR